MFFGTFIEKLTLTQIIASCICFIDLSLVYHLHKSFGDLTHALEAERISVLFLYIFWNRIFPEDFFYFNKFLFELLKKIILSSRLQENEDLLVVFVFTIYSAKKKSKQWESVYSILHQVRNFSCFQACQNKWRFTVQNVDYIYKGYLVFIFESENLKQNATSPRPRNGDIQNFCKWDCSI